MKRSRTVKLTLMGLAGGMVTGCSEPQEEIVTFKSVAECKASGLFEASDCEYQYEKAVAANQLEAPRYDSRYNCEMDFGAEQCQPSRSSGFWQPFMAGYMMSMIARDVGNSLYYRSAYSRPLYRSRDDWGMYRTSNNYPVGSYGSTGRASKLPRSIMTTVPNNSGQIKRSSGQYGKKAATVSRGGFGSKTAARGGWGS
ncbi:MULTISPECIES: DUF1190 domain-containing protein [Corallincola]|uniref:DUF1190 domain-containing protein n=3 Tax=Corallincola TaxID=1775176 RepID=A0A368NFT2_9GAMM|nr:MULTISPECIES: DUF1190 domain-containing protein [Corallincola]RCU49497.1 DUF1190 domain-containing protein [Corallincola holothuriorum]TAA47788.1 DUF1190 domain-containing protein [Corallincola spongiicola]TCI02066.1 DUF1190 domain-containing protein [Corallincola luteus]